MHRAIPLTAAVGLAIILCGCGSIGNFNDYTVTCAPDANSWTALQSTIAAVSKARNEKSEIDTNPDGGYNAVFRRDLFIWFFQHPGSKFYFIDLRREWNSDEDTEILTARDQIETAVRQSICPTFERRIRHYKATTWAH
jgi:hypothetical protein